jgi:hypothetical protein
MRFHQPFKLLPGIRLNFSKSGFGLSAGVRGLRVGVDAKGRSYVNAGIPGTGLSVRKYGKRESAVHEPSEPGAARTGSAWGLVAIAALVLIGILRFTQHGEHPPAPPPLTPERNAIQVAEQELARSHPEFNSTRISQDGPFPATPATDGFAVRRTPGAHRHTKKGETPAQNAGGKFTAIAKTRKLIPGRCDPGEETCWRPDPLRPDGGESHRGMLRRLRRA